MSFRRNDIFMHRTEGWYGIVINRRGEGTDEVYTVQTLEPRKVLRFADMEPVSKDQLPHELDDLQVVGRHVEEAQMPID